MDPAERFEFGPDEPVTTAGRSSGTTLVVVLVSLVAIAAGGAYIYLFEREWLRTTLQGTPLEPAPSTTTIYKWQDSQGNWQLTDQPPPGGVAYESSDYRSDTNVMPLVPKDED